MSRMRKCEHNKDWQVIAKDFMDLIQPSFATIGSTDDMGAFLARAHMILLTDHGCLLAQSQYKEGVRQFHYWRAWFWELRSFGRRQRIVQAYEADPADHRLRI